MPLRDPTESTPVEIALLERIQHGRAEADAGRLQSAEEEFVWVLSATRGSGTRAEVQATSSLVTIYSREQRDFETLPLARRLVEHGRETREPAILCQGLAAVVNALNDLDDYGRVLGALDELETALASLPAGSPVRAHHQRVIHGTRSDAEISRGNVARACLALHKFRETFDHDFFRPSEERWLRILEAHVALHLGCPGHARSHLATARRLPVPESVGRLAIEYLQVWVALETRGPAAARSAAAELLEHLETVGPEEYGHSQRIRFLTRIGDLLMDRAQAPDLAQVIYDLAGAAMIGRIIQLNRHHERSENLPVTDDDREALSEYRVHFREAHQKLLTSVVSLFRILEDAQIDMSREDSIYFDDRLFLCVHCLRVCAARNSWLPIGHLVPDDPALRVRHVICPECG